LQAGLLPELNPVTDAVAITDFYKNNNQINIEI